METDNNALFEYKGWHIVRKIGSGSFGTVYEIAREDFGSQYKAALKVISIPQSEQDLSQVKKNIGKNDKSLEVYYKSVASEIVKEFEMMYKLKGFSNIVSYEDHEVRKHRDGIGWDIMIRMELLTPLDVYRKKHTMTREEVVRLGIDICKALERCEKYGIVHRDIKPGNIFVSEQGDFKLGDFGIARTIEAHDEVLELSQKGTINYMAPEVFKGGKYDFRVDLYSLGIVLYRFLNRDTLPFLPLTSGEVTFGVIENAKQLRLSGEPLPRPCDDNTQLADVVLKACRYCPKDRYQSPGEMRKHLEMVLREEIIAPRELVSEEKFVCELPAISDDEGTAKIPLDNGESGISPPVIDEKENERKVEEFPEKQNDKAENEKSPLFWGKKLVKTLLRVILVVIIAMVVFVIAIMIFAMSSSESDVGQQPQQTIIEDETGVSSTPEPVTTVEPEKSELESLIEQHNFVMAYKMIQDSTNDGENLDTEIQLFVKACQSEREFKRAVAAMNLLSENVLNNEAFYRETVKWFYEHDKVELVRQMMSDLRNHGTEGVNLADVISLEYTDINTVEEDEKE